MTEYQRLLDLYQSGMAHQPVAEIGESWMLTCPGIRASKTNRLACGYVATLDRWEVGGACDGMAICPWCTCRVNIETGKEMEPCGDCEFCTE